MKLHHCCPLQLTLSNARELWLHNAHTEALGPNDMHAYTYTHTHQHIHTQKKTHLHNIYNIPLYGKGGKRAGGWGFQNINCRGGGFNIVHNNSWDFSHILFWEDLVGGGGGRLCKPRCVKFKEQRRIQSSTRRILSGITELPPPPKKILFMGGVWGAGGDKAYCARLNGQRRIQSSTRQILRHHRIPPQKIKTWHPPAMHRNNSPLSQMKCNFSLNFQ